MRKKNHLLQILALVFFICFSTGFDQNLLASEPVSLKLTLKEAVRMALEKNLDVRAELYNPALYEADINRGLAIYDPKFTFQTRYDDMAEEKPTPSETVIDTQAFSTGVSLGRLFSTGATAAVSFNNSDNDTNNPALLDHYSLSGFTLSISQPLFKNRGREVTEEGIRISRISKGASLERFRAKLISTIAQVRYEYFKLYRLREELVVKQKSLDLSQTILAETRTRVQSGVLPAIEVLNAQFGVAKREKELIDAQKAVGDQLDVLRILLQLSAGVNIATTDNPSREAYDMAEPDAIALASSRPDILEQKKNLELNEFQSAVNKNRLEPDLSLTTSAGLNAVDRSREHNVLGVGRLDNFNWSVGLLFSYPLGNKAAENDYLKSRLKTEQTKLKIKSLEENVENEVRAALRGIRSGFKQIEVTDQGLEFAEQRLNSFIRKNQVGLATTKEVLDVETELATARNNQIAALTAYADALTRLWQVTGELLDRQGVQVDETEADRLYKDIK